jgi:large subunit ribosomal protein L22
VKQIMVDEGRTMKRMRTAPQGRGYRIRKRSNHITVILGSRVEEAPKAEVETK